MYFRTEWHWRGIWTTANLTIRTAASNSQAKTPASEPSDTNGVNVSKGKSDCCLLQSECERKECGFIRKELKCPYYLANAREGYYIEDQEKIRNRQFREHRDHDTVAFLESLKNNGDDKNNCSC